MKVICILMFILISLSLVFSKQNDWKFIELKGKIKERSTIYYSISKNVKVIKYTIILKFDYEGYKTDEIKLDQDNKIIYQKSFIYDDKKNIIKETSKKSDGSIDYQYNIKISYNKNGNITERKVVNYDNKIQWSDKFDYDNNNKTKSYFYDPNGKLLEGRENKFDNNGNIIESEYTLIFNNNKKFKDIYIFNSLNQIIEKNTFSMNLGRWIPEYTLKTKTLYKYDTNNRIIEESIINSDNVTETKHLWKYDKNGNLIEWSEYNADNLVIGKNIIKYDNKNNIIEKTKYMSPDLIIDSLETFSYVYYSN